MFLANLLNAIGLFVIHLTHNDVPWFLTAILCLNLALLVVSSIINDMKDRNRDERIEQLEKELAKLKNTCLDYWASNGNYSFEKELNELRRK